MQLMCHYSEENNTACLGIFDETVRLFKGEMLKVPHMGWNSLTKVRGWLDPALEGNYVYFVHSYYVPPTTYTVAETDYGIPFSAALRKNNFYAVQFHPEKSAEPRRSSRSRARACSGRRNFCAADCPSARRSPA